MRLSELTSNEYAPYYKGYLEGLEDLNLSELLMEGLTLFDAIEQELRGKGAGFRYAPDKWSIEQVLVHVTDTERVFQSRALWFGRCPGADLPGFDQDVFMQHVPAGTRSIEELLEEFRVVRQSTRILYSTFDETVLRQQGSVEGRAMSVRALGFIICGHQHHHYRIIKERYLK